MPAWSETLLMWVGAAAMAAPVVGLLLAVGFCLGVGLSVYVANRIVVFLERKGLLP